MRFRVSLVVIITCAALVGCNMLVDPTASPTHAFTGPTLDVSPVFFPVVPTMPEMIIGMNNPQAAYVPSGGDLPPIMIATPSANDLSVGQIVLVAGQADDALYNGQLYAPHDDRMPGILMLAPDSDVWGNLPMQFVSDGYSVLTLELPPNAPLSDFSHMLRSLSDSPVVNPGVMVVIGVEHGADYAIQGCATELLCDGVVALSPLDYDGDRASMTMLQPRPLFAIVGESDPESARVGLLLSEYTLSTVHFVDNATRGIDVLLMNPSLSEIMHEWLADVIAAELAAN